MRRSSRTSTVLLAAILTFGLTQYAFASSEAPWLHLRVTHGDGSEAVNLNVPFSLAEGLVQMVDANDFSVDFRADLPAGFTLADVRDAWQDLKTGGQQLLSVDSGSESVRMAIEGESLRLAVTELREGLTVEKVNVELPTRIVDALLSGDDETLDLHAALEELRHGALGDILTVRDGDETVRIWID